jgi:hypothetical protein
VPRRDSPVRTDDGRPSSGETDRPAERTVEPAHRFRRWADPREPRSTWAGIRREASRLEVASRAARTMAHPTTSSGRPTREAAHRKPAGAAARTRARARREPRRRDRLAHRAWATRSQGWLHRECRANSRLRHPARHRPLEVDWGLIALAAEVSRQARLPAAAHPEEHRQQVASEPAPSLASPPGRDQGTDRLPPPADRLPPRALAPAGRAQARAARHGPIWGIPLRYPTSSRPRTVPRCRQGPRPPIRLTQAGSEEWALAARDRVRLATAARLRAHLSVPRNRPRPRRDSLARAPSPRARADR